MSFPSYNGVLLGVIVFVLTAVLPEGISHNIPISEKISFARHINPLQFEVIPKDIADVDTYVGGSIGFKLYQSLGKDFLISPSVEFKAHYYKQAHPGFSIGMIFSRVIKSKKNKS